MRRHLYIFIALLTALSVVGAPPKKGNKKTAVDHSAAAAEARAKAEKNLKAYNLDEASDDLDDWESALDAMKKEYPEDLELMRDRILMARNMLERVEKIEIIDTLQVDSVEFFQHYVLSADAGAFFNATALPDEYASLMPAVVYAPQSNKEMLWGMPDEMGRITLVAADVLDDGTIDQPKPFGDALGEADTDFPFMMQDGVTLYYAATGEGSLGGYDIFMTRRGDDGEMLQPQNIGMPFNSPYNDYLLAIDEFNNIGWWASDRDNIPGKVTIYVFVPSQMRVNYDPESDDIASYALLNNLEVEGNLDDKLADIISEETSDEEEFFFPLGDGRVYTSLNDFKNHQARQAMRNLLKRMMDFEVSKADLANLREAYASGDKSVAEQIQKLEKTVHDMPSVIKRNINQIISLEK